MKRKINTSQQLKEAANYISESFDYILISFFLFLISAFLGFIYADKLGFLDSIIRSLINKTLNMNVLELFFFIFQNNLNASLKGLFVGVFFGVFPIINVFSNGILLGYVAEKVNSLAGTIDMWRILPHGIFELPAIFISFGLGIKLGMFVFSQNPIKELKRRFYNSANVFLMIVVPLLLIAALIESLLIMLGG